jgi:hypothetical protein
MGHIWLPRDDIKKISKNVTWITCWFYQVRQIYGVEKQNHHDEDANVETTSDALVPERSHASKTVRAFPLVSACRRPDGHKRRCSPISYQHRGMAHR